MLTEIQKRWNSITAPRPTVRQIYVFGVVLYNVMESCSVCRRWQTVFQVMTVCLKPYFCQIMKADGASRGTPGADVTSTLIWRWHAVIQFQTCLLLPTPWNTATSVKSKATRATVFSERLEIYHILNQGQVEQGPLLQKAIARTFVLLDVMYYFFFFAWIGHWYTCCPVINWNSSQNK